MNRLFAILFLALVFVRVPSVVEPAGNDQGLYAYVGQAIARGEVPYRDAWDQKPPAIHFTYALLWAVWPGDGAVAAADLAVAAAVGLLLIAMGRRLTGDGVSGKAAAALFLLLGNPAFQRLGGLYVRAQCETFIALLAVGALALMLGDDCRRPGRRRALDLGGAGALLGIAFLFKYNAAAYLLAAAVTILLLPIRKGRMLASAAAMTVGFTIPVVVAALYFVLAGAFDDLLQATVVYNIGYSGETYRGALGFARYLLAFPVQHAAVDSLWMLGGAGCAVLLVAAITDRKRLIVPVWVAAACLSIAVNSGRGLPQYFVQALPLLALAAGIAGTLAWRASGPLPRAVACALIVIAVVRVSPFDKAVRNTQFDARHLAGRSSRSEYLARFATDRYSASALTDLADGLRRATSPGDRVFVFGFSGGAYVRADRPSASRFFWSRPILVGFNEGRPRYGATGLLADLEAARPAIVALQQHDWPAEGTDSATYFLAHPRLGAWLRREYALTARNDMYQVWSRHVEGTPGVASR